VFYDGNLPFKHYHMVTDCTKSGKNQVSGKPGQLLSKKILDVPTPEGFTSCYKPALNHSIYALKSINQNIDRPHMVLIHGAIVSRRYMIPTAIELGQSFNVIVPDLPGHGYSSKPVDALSVEEQAEAVRDWLRHNNIERTHLLANSYGCQIVMEIALRYPEVVESLTLVATVADPAAPTIFEQAARLFFDGLFERPSLPFLVMRDIYDLGWKRAYQTAKHMMAYPLKERAERILTRSLVVRGGKDPLVSEKWAEIIAQSLPDGQFVSIAEAPHGVVYCNAERLSKLVHQFILPADG